jgi:HK97 family phage major capsid protein
MFPNSNAPTRAVIDGRDSWVFPNGRVLPVISGGDETATAEVRTLADLQLAARAELEDGIVARATEVIALAETEQRVLTDEEAQIVRDAATATRELDQTIEAQIQIQRGNDLVAYERPAQRAVGGAIVRSEPMTYSREASHSYFRDLALQSLARNGHRSDKYQPSVDERLERHGREIAVETRAGTTTDGAGGEFVPPLWLLSEYVPIFRSGRATADLARSLPLPSGTDSVNIPTITTGTLTAVQATENSAATTRDLATGSTTAEVTTVAGYYDASVQLVEQSALAGGFDALVYGDLVADRNRATDVLVLSGTGANNQPVGVLTAAFTTVTVATAAATALYAGIADGMNRVATNRFDMPQVIIMHPRRWFWLVSRFDSQGRPLVTPDAGAGQNLIAAMGMPEAQGVVGTMLGLPVVIDANVPTTTSTHFDDVIVWRPSDAILMEGAPRLEAFRDVLSATLGVRFRLYNYAAFTTRTSLSAAKLTGAGLTGPTF